MHITKIMRIYIGVMTLGLAGSAYAQPFEPVQPLPLQDVPMQELPLENDPLLESPLQQQQIEEGVGSGQDRLTERPPPQETLLQMSAPLENSPMEEIPTGEFPSD